MSHSKELSDISKPIVLVGAGKMGSAMLQGWLARGLDPARVAVIEPQPADEKLMDAVTALSGSGPA
jgi:pyrroline-5-carboxylate reductase